MEKLEELNNKEEKNNIIETAKKKIKEELNMDKQFKLTEESKEINSINDKLSISLSDKKNVDLDEILYSIKNVEEIVLDIDRKVYINLDAAKKINELEEKLKEIHELLENSLLVGKNAVLYYLKKNKNKPIKLGVLYKKFGKKVVNEVIIELYEKGFIRILR